MAFNNAVLQQSGLTPPGTSSMPKIGKDGNPEGLFVYAVEDQLWDEQLAAERKATAYRAQTAQVERGFQHQSIARAADARAAARHQQIAEVHALESVGDLGGANKIRENVRDPSIVT